MKKDRDSALFSFLINKKENNNKETITTKDEHANDAVNEKLLQVDTKSAVSVLNTKPTNIKENKEPVGKDSRKSIFMEVITFYNTSSDSFTNESRHLLSFKDGRVNEIASYDLSSGLLNPKVNNNSSGIAIRIPGSQPIITQDENEANLIFSKIMELTIGKGNNYLLLRENKVTSLTIPFKSKKKGVINNTNEKA